MEGEINDFFNLIRKKRQTIASVVVVFLFLAIVVTFVQPLKYSSESRLLVVQNFPEETDPYATSKSNEYLSSLLSKIVASNLFYDDIMNSGFPIDKSYFLKNGNNKKEMNKWRATVQSRAIFDTGIIEINVYHPDKQQLNQIANAVNFVLKSKHNLYHGAGDSVSIKVIDKPILSNYPTKPNVLLNIFISVIFALILSASYIYLFPEEKNEIRLWPKRRKKEINKNKHDHNNKAEEINDNWKAIGDIIAERAERIAKPSAFGINDNLTVDTEKDEDAREIKSSETEQTEDNKKKEDEEISKPRIVIPKLSNIEIPDKDDEEYSFKNNRDDYSKYSSRDIMIDESSEEDDETLISDLDNKNKNLGDNKDYDIFEDSEIEVEKNFYTNNSNSDYRDNDKEDNDNEIEEISKKGNMNNLF